MVDASIQLVDGSIQMVDGSIQMVDGSIQMVDGSIQTIDGSIYTVDVSIEMIDAWRASLCDASAAGTAALQLKSSVIRTKTTPMSNPPTRLISSAVCTVERRR